LDCGGGESKVSKLIDKAKPEGPQEIAKYGRTTVIVAAEGWERKAKRQGNLAEFLAASSLRGSGLKLEPPGALT